LRTYYEPLPRNWNCNSEKYLCSRGIYSLVEKENHKGIAIKISNDDICLENNNR
jgi:hypothetical protein